MEQYEEAELKEECESLIGFLKRSIDLWDKTTEDDLNTIVESFGKIMSESWDKYLAEFPNQEDKNIICKEFNVVNEFFRKTMRELYGSHKEWDDSDDKTLVFSV